MGELKRIEIDCVSYCDIPEILTDGTWLQEFPCNCFIEYTLQEGEPISTWILETHTELFVGDNILIEIDY